MPQLCLFDLDNTLHQADAGIFACINQRMTDFIAQELQLSSHEASQLREHYWHQYGATLHGLRLHHGIAPDRFLHHSHPLDQLLPLLHPMPDTDFALRHIPQRKAILSNAPHFYIQALIGAMQLHHHFEALIGIDTLQYHQKPDPQAYQQACTRLQVAYRDCILIDDSLPNLIAAKQLGIQTVWYHPQAQVTVHTDAIAHNMRQLAQLPLFHNNPTATH